MVCNSIITKPNWSDKITSDLINKATRLFYLKLSSFKTPQVLLCLCLPNVISPLELIHESGWHFKMDKIDYPFGVNFIIEWAIFVSGQF